MLLEDFKFSVSYCIALVVLFLQQFQFPTFNFYVV
jgi:hypothetical protein